MAIFIASTKSISRAKGQSAVASASYRAGEKLYDNRHGKNQDYSKRTGVMSANIIMPNSLKNQSISRADLWNLAEKSEKRKDSRVAREWLINLPHELDEQSRKELAHTFAQALADKYGVIADCALHRPTDKEILRGADPRNFHAHIMLTTRQVELKNGELILDKKADSELSDNDRKKKGLPRMSDEITQIRELWEMLANEKLAEHNLELIDRRSYEELGIDRLPQIKMGAGATALERDGKPTAKGDINREILEYNELVFNRELEYIEQTNSQADSIIFESRKRHERAEQQREQQRITEDRIRFASQITQRAEQRIANTADSEQQIGTAEQQIARAERISNTAESRIADGKQRVKQSKSDVNDNSKRIDWTIKVIDNNSKRIDDNSRRGDWAIQVNGNNSKRIDRAKSSIDDNSKRVSESEQRITESGQELNKQAESAQQSKLSERFLNNLKKARQSLDFSNQAVADFASIHTPLSFEHIQERREMYQGQTYNNIKTIDVFSLPNDLATFSVSSEGTFITSRFKQEYGSIKIEREFYELSDVVEIVDDSLLLKKLQVELPLSSRKEAIEIAKMIDTSKNFKQHFEEKSVNQNEVKQVVKNSPATLNNSISVENQNDDYGLGF